MPAKPDYPTTRVLITRDRASLGMDTMACTYQTSLVPSGMGLVEHQHGDLPHTWLYAGPTEPMTPDQYHGPHLLTQYLKLGLIVPKLQTS